MLIQLFEITVNYFLKWLYQLTPPIECVREPVSSPPPWHPEDARRPLTEPAYIFSRQGLLFSPQLLRGRLAFAELHVCVLPGHSPSGKALPGQSGSQGNAWKLQPSLPVRDSWSAHRVHTYFHCSLFLHLILSPSSLPKILQSLSNFLVHWWNFKLFSILLWVCLLALNMATVVHNEIFYNGREGSLWVGPVCCLVPCPQPRVSDSLLPHRPWACEPWEPSVHWGWSLRPGNKWPAEFVSTQLKDYISPFPAAWCGHVTIVEWQLLERWNLNFAPLRSLPVTTQAKPRHTGSSTVLLMFPLAHPTSPHYFSVQGLPFPRKPGSIFTLVNSYSFL